MEGEHCGKEGKETDAHTPMDPGPLPSGGAAGTGASVLPAARPTVLSGGGWLWVPSRDQDHSEGLASGALGSSGCCCQCLVLTVLGVASPSVCLTQGPLFTPSTSLVSLCPWTKALKGQPLGRGQVLRMDR